MLYKLKMKMVRGMHDVKQWFWRRKMNRVKAEHGGDLSTASPETVKDLLGPIDPDFGSLVGFAAAIHSLSIILNKDHTDWALFSLVGNFMHGRCDSAKEEQYVLNLIRKPNPKHVVLNELVKLGDLQEHQINYHKEVIDKWLLED